MKPWILFQCSLPTTLGTAPSTLMTRYLSSHSGRSRRGRVQNRRGIENNGYLQPLRGLPEHLPNGAEVGGRWVVRGGWGGPGHRGIWRWPPGSGLNLNWLVERLSIAEVLVQHAVHSSIDGRSLQSVFDVYHCFDEIGLGALGVWCVTQRLHKLWESTTSHGSYRALLNKSYTISKSLPQPLLSLCISLQTSE